MSDTQRLREQLSEIGKSSPTQAARELNGDTAHEVLQNLLREIHETILPRKMAFKNSHGGILQLEVASRRILRINSANLKSNGAENTEIAGQNINDVDSPLVSNFREYLQSFLLSTAEVEIISTRSEANSDPSQVGCAAQSLADLWGLELYPVKPEIPHDILKQFIGACSQSATAWVVFKDVSPIEIHGDAELTEPLSHLSPEQMADFDAKIIRAPDQKRTLGCVNLKLQTDADVSLLFARDEDHRAFICIPNHQISTALKSWQDLIG